MHIALVPIWWFWSVLLFDPILIVINEYIFIEYLEQILKGLATCQLPSCCSWNGGVTRLHACRLVPMPCCIRRPSWRQRANPILILEAVVNHNLLLWHSCSNHLGSWNYINVWDKSSLLWEFLDHKFSEDVDFKSEINCTVFHQASGENLKAFLSFFIYLFFYQPGLGHSCWHLFRPCLICGDHKWAMNWSTQKYPKWLEGSMKVFECAFGVLQWNLQFLWKMWSNGTYQTYLRLLKLVLSLITLW